MVGGEQRHAIDRASGARKQWGREWEQDEGDERGDQLEQDVGDSQPLCRRARADRRHGGTGRGSDVLPDNERQALLESDRARIKSRQGYGDRGRGRLHYRGHDQSGDNQRQETDDSGQPTDAGRAEDCGQVRRVERLRKAAHALLERGEAIEDEREARE